MEQSYENERFRTLVDVDLGEGQSLVGSASTYGGFVSRYDTSDLSLKGVCDIKGLYSIMQVAVSKVSGKVVIAGIIDTSNRIPFVAKDSLIPVKGYTSCLIELHPKHMKVSKALPFRFGVFSYPYFQHAFNKMDFDGQDNLIIVGYCGGGSVDAGLLSGDTLVRPSKLVYEDIVYIKYTHDYHLKWFYRFDGSQQSYGYSLKVEENGDFYVSAYVGWSNPLDIDLSEGVTNVASGSYIAKYNPDAHLLWHAVMDAQSTVAIYDIEAEAGAVYGTGLYQGANARLHPGEPFRITPFVGVFDAFYFKYAPPVITSIDTDLGLEPSLLVHPNPCKGQVVLSAPYEHATLYDLSGRQVQSFDGGSVLDLSSISEGMYTLIVQTKDQTYTRKLLKE